LLLVSDLLLLGEAGAEGPCEAIIVLSNTMRSGRSGAAVAPEWLRSVVGARCYYTRAARVVRELRIY